MGLLGMVAAIYAIQATLRLRVEETEQRAEPVLGTAVTRLRWAGSHLVYPALGTVVLLAAAGLTAGLAHGLRTHDLGGQLPNLIEGALVQAPATWVLAAVAVTLYGLAPRITMASWAVLGATLFVGWLGPALQLNQRIMDISPFTHTPKIPGAELAATPMVWLLGITAALTVLGLAGFRRRDIG
jgi:ABC-2 type transport system permease protein